MVNAQEQHSRAYIGLLLNDVTQMIDAWLLQHQNKERRGKLNRGSRQSGGGLTVIHSDQKSKNCSNRMEPRVIIADPNTVQQSQSFMQNPKRVNQILRKGTTPSDKALVPRFRINHRLLARRIPVHSARISARQSNFARDLFRNSNVQVVRGLRGVNSIWRKLEQDL
ncbi:hypothetical protein CEXT_184931 [Caerostris extrusa]|uniref:Uncharacterized protein n=1 Tax=Caerostris extrusa TaxID=172846 RepID=A0AAV4TB82_CAEEX|nr:hypothetical protein CEXT_184931 [Caerostris extrusa]